MTAKVSRRPRRDLLRAAATAMGAAGLVTLTRAAEAGPAPSYLEIDADNTGSARTQLRADHGGTAFRVENRHGSGSARNAIFAQLGGVSGADPDVPTAIAALNTVSDPEAIGVRGFASGVGVAGHGSGANGVGIYGSGTSVGVHGSVNSATGVMGTVLGTSGYGVRGIGDDAGSWGVRAEGGSGGTALSVLGAGGIPGAGDTAGGTPPGPAMLVEGSAVLDGPLGLGALKRAYIDAGQASVKVRAASISGSRGRADVLVTLQSDPGGGATLSHVVKGRGVFEVVLTKAATKRTALAYLVASRV